MAPHEWRYVNHANDLRARREATVLVLEDWRHRRSMSDWLEIEETMRAMNDCIVPIPPKHGLQVDEWLEAVLKAFDAARVRPRVMP